VVVRRAPSAARQARVLIARMTTSRQGSLLAPLEFGMHAALGATLGLLWWRAAAGDVTRSDDALSKYASVCFFVIAHWSWTPAFQVHEFLSGSTLGSRVGSVF
jgi:hypothetical protein